MRSGPSAIDTVPVHAPGAARRWAAILLLTVAVTLSRWSVRHRIARLRAGDGRDARRRLHDAGVAAAERPVALTAAIAALTLIAIVGWLLLHPDHIPI